MISVETAQNLVFDQLIATPSETLPLNRVLGRFLAEAISSPMDLPSFDNSAMDGYALRAEDTALASPENLLSFSLVGTSSAGDPWEGRLHANQAIRILTGARVPSSATGVIKQEDVGLQEGEVIISRPVVSGENIRRQGEELKKGAAVFPSHSALSPASIGLLASLGIQELSVFTSPRVGILVTGSEITPIHQDLKPGQIYDSNSFSLMAALQELNISPSFVTQCPDQRETLLKQVALGFEESDILLVTGGVSVGDFDFVREVGQELGVEEVFWKVRQKPGKPLFFGKKGAGKYLFGLPGNPASTLVCFYEYVRPALLKTMGSEHPRLPRFYLPLKKDLKNSQSRTHFLRGQLEETPKGLQVSVEKQQGSHTMHSFAGSQCLVILPPETEFKAGDPIEVDLIPSALWNPLGG